MTADPSDYAAAFGATKGMVVRGTGALGCRTLTGGGMARFQSLDAFRSMTGVQPDVARMQRHIAFMVG